LGEPETFWDEAGIQSGVAGAESITPDEAIELGLLPKDMEE
jgi:hypothetical protein